MRHPLNKKRRILQSCSVKPTRAASCIPLCYLARHGICGLTWHGLVWCGLVWLGCGMVWYGMVWCCMVWRGMAWYGVVWRGCGMVWHGVAWVEKEEMQEIHQRSSPESGVMAADGWGQTSIISHPPFSSNFSTLSLERVDCTYGEASNDVTLALPSSP